MSDTIENASSTTPVEEPSPETDNDELRQGLRQKFIFFLKHSYRDVFRHPCHFCLAFSAVFITALSALVVQTVID